ncbi:MAG: hypothetical protein JWO59_3429 [Chloroflexi bacterium]|nr:hypothetical protein [Chloroflexota bacterium]
MPHIVPILLLAAPLLAALLCLIPVGPRVAELVSALDAIAVVSLAIWIATSTTATPIRIEPGIYIDALSATMVLLIGVVSAVVVLYSLGYLRAEVRRGKLNLGQIRWYFCFLHLFIFSMLLVPLAGNLGIVWVAMEFTTVLSGVLVGFYRSGSALEAAWKYVVICSLGIGLALFGTVLMYYSAVQILGQGNNALDWATLARVAPHLNPGLVRLSFAFVLVGFGTKAGLAPMHTWLPDAHSQSPSPVSALLSAVLLNCALYAVLRYHALAIRVLGPAFSSHLLIAFGLFSIAVAVPFLLVQHDIKRLLAYSSMEHIGIITVASGIGGRLGFFAALLHLVNHAMTKSFMFLASGTLIQRLETRNIHRLGGASRAAPILVAMLLLGGLALAGSPPFSPFIGEFLTVRAALLAGQPLVGGVLLVLLALAFAGLLAHFGRIALGPPSRKGKHLDAKAVPTAYERLGICALSVPAAIVLVLGLHVPDGLATLLHNASQVIGGA